MIVTKRESMPSLIHDTIPTLRHSLQQSHNKALYYGFRFIGLLSFILLVLAVRVIERNNNFLCSLHQ